MNKMMQDKDIKISHSIAEVMGTFALDFKCKHLDPSQCYATGLLSRIGKIGSDSNYEIMSGHIVNSFIKDSTLPIMVQALYCQSLSPREYSRIYDCPLELIPNEIILMWFATHMVQNDDENPGNIIGLDSYLDLVAKCNSDKGLAYTYEKETVDFLKDRICQLGIAEKVVAYIEQWQEQ